MREIYIHCGLHKTGSTSLQLTLFKNREKLAVLGFNYPNEGIPPHLFGHHNLAWQLSRDRRFRREFGDFSSLFHNININQKIILSSEDFESSLLHPIRWSKILPYFEHHKIKVIFIIYFRNCINYLESLYSELLKVGIGNEYLYFATNIIRNKKFYFNEWEFVFNYANILASLNTFNNSKVIIRNYDKLAKECIVHDFCEVAGIDVSKIDLPIDVRHINKRPPLNTLLKLFFRNRVREIKKDAYAIIDELCGNENGHLTSPLFLKNSFDKMSWDNLKLFNQNPQETEMSQNHFNELDMNKVFSFETCLIILDIESVKDNKIKKQALIRNWREWVKAGHKENG